MSPWCGSVVRRDRRRSRCGSRSHVRRRCPRRCTPQRCRRPGRTTRKRSCRQEPPSAATTMLSADRSGAGPGRSGPATICIYAAYRGFLTRLWRVDPALPACPLMTRAESVSALGPGTRRAAGEASDPKVALRSGAVSLDPRTPVLVGAGQVTAHPQASEPTLGAPRARRADGTGARGGCPRLRGQRGGPKAPRAGGFAPDPSALWPGVTRTPACWSRSASGSSLRRSLSRASEETGRNCSRTGPPLPSRRVKLDVALIAGAECLGTRISARRDPDHPGLAWTTQPAGTPEPVILDEERDPVTALERAASLDRPVRVFPLFANALRARCGKGPRSKTPSSSLRCGPGSRRSRPTNPYAWSPQVANRRRGAHGFGPDNRMVAFPYPKLEMANDRVDQGAAFIMCSLESAADAGVPEDRMVFPIAGSDANDHWFLTHRMDLLSSPAIRLASRHALSLANVAIDDVAHIDLYSCFPCAVQIAAAEIGLPIYGPRPASDPHGWPRFRGRARQQLRESRHSDNGHEAALRRRHGLVTGLGWYSTKHSIGVWSSRPAADGFRSEKCPERSRLASAALTSPERRGRRRRDRDLHRHGRPWRRTRSRNRRDAHPATRRGCGGRSPTRTHCHC